MLASTTCLTLPLARVWAIHLLTYSTHWRSVSLRKPRFVVVACVGVGSTMWPIVGFLLMTVSASTTASTWQSARPVCTASVASAALSRRMICALGSVFVTIWSCDEPMSTATFTSGLFNSSQVLGL